MLLNQESLRKIIKAPNLTKFSFLTEDKIALLESAIIKIKLIQCNLFSANLQSNADSSFPRSKEELQNILLYSIDHSKLTAVFLANHPDEDNEYLLGIQPEKKVKHFFIRQTIFLDRGTYSDATKKKLIAPISSRLLNLKQLQLTHPTSISNYFLEPISELTIEEQILFNNIYSREKLCNRIYAREAHSQIQLDLTEIQSIVISFAEAWIENNFAPTANIVVRPISDFPVHSDILSRYTNSQAFNLVNSNDVQGLVEHIKRNDNNPNIINYQSRRSLLTWAVRLQRTEIVESLIKLGANLDLVDYPGCKTAFHYAIETKNKAIFEMLLAAQSDVNVTSLHEAPLHIAVEIGSEEFVQMLLQRGANPNLKNYLGHTPLHLAVEKNLYGIAKILLAHPATNLNIKNKRNLTALDLALHQDMQRLFSQHTAAILTPQQIALRDKNPFEFLRRALEDPIKHRQELATHAALKLTGMNPFLNFESSFPSSSTTNMIDDFFGLMHRQRTYEVQITDKFYLIIKKLEKLAALNKNDSAYAYIKIIEIAGKIEQEKISMLAYSYELVRYDFLNQLINLHLKKSIMQVAIESEDSETIIQLITSEPNRLLSKYLLPSKKNQLITELEFAIYSGKPESVKAFLEAATKIPTSKLGDIPHNAVLLAEIRKEDISSVPLFQNNERFVCIRSAQNCSRNWKYILRSLQNNLPTSETKPVHGFFTQAEYEIVKLSVGEKEQHRSSVKERWQLLIRKTKAHQLLTAERGALPNTQENEEDRKFIDYALQTLANEKMPQKRQYKQQFHFPRDRQYIANTFRLTTKNYQLLSQRDQLPTVEHLLKGGNVLISFNTPATQRNTISFSVGGSKPGQYSDLYSDQYLPNNFPLFELNITEARRSGLIGSTDVYTLPHIHAYNMVKVKAPIIFIGEDPRIKTIYRVFHSIKQSTNPTTPGEQYYTTHWFDYYEDNRWVGSYQYELEMRQEFFQDENIKAKAYLFIKLLRDIKGPFQAGSFYHYVINNLHNIKIIESAMSALFNANRAGKIGKNIPLDHPAVKIIAAETTQQIDETENSFASINSLESLQSHLWVQEGKLEEVSQLTPHDINGYKGESLLIEAVTHQQLEVVNLLLAKVKLAYLRLDNIILGAAFDKLNEAYLKPNGIENPQFKTALSICELLLYYGTHSQLDPEHIHYGASPDNWEDLAEKQILEDHSKQALWPLKRFLLSYREFSLHEMILAGVTKKLESLYEFTFRFALFETHQYIAKRLNKSPLSINKNEGETFELATHFNQAIREGNLAVFEQFYLAYEQKRQQSDEFAPDSQLDLVFSPVFIALRFNQFEIFKNALTKAMKAGEENYSLQRLFQYACSWDQLDAIKLLIANGIYLPTDEYLVDAIKKQSFERFSLLAPTINLNKSDKQSIGTSDRANIRPLIKAVKQKNTKIINELLKIYSKTFGKNNFKSALKVTCIVASRLKETHIFADLLEKCIKLTNKKFIMLFFQVILDELIEKSSTECFTYFINKVKSQYDIEQIIPDAIYVDPTKMSLCQVILKEEITKLELLQKYLPDYLMLSQCWGYLATKINLKMMEHLLTLNLLNEAQEQINILSCAIMGGRLDIVKWLFEKIIAKDYTNNLGENILHLLAKEIYGYAHDSELDACKVRECIDYLCMDLNIDVNHQDKSGTTPLLAQAFSLTSDIAPDQVQPMTLFLERLTNYLQINLILSRQDGYTILHSRILSATLIEKYKAQSGNFNVFYNDISPLEAALVYSPKVSKTERDSFTEVIDTLKLYCSPPRDLIPAQKTDGLRLVTGDIDNKTFLVFVNKSPFSNLLPFARNKNCVNYRFKEFEGSQRTFPLLTHIKRKEKKSSNLIKAAKTNTIWGKRDQSIIECFELPSANQLKQITDDIYQITKIPQPIFINKFFKTLLPLISTFKKIESNQLYFADYSLISTRDYDHLLEEYKDCYRKLQTIYTQIIRGDTQFLDGYTQAFTLGLPFACYLLKDGKYQPSHFSSAFDAAFQTSQFNVIKLLLNHVIELKQEPAILNTILCEVIQRNNKEGLEILLQPENKISSVSIVNCLRKLKWLGSPEMIYRCLLYLDSINCPPSIVKSIRSDILLCARNNQKPDDPIYKAILETLANIENNSKTPPKNTTKQSSSMNIDKLEKRKREKDTSESRAPSKRARAAKKISAPVPTATQNQTPNLSNALAVANSPVFSGKRRREPIPDQGQQVKQEREHKKTKYIGGSFS
jgi:hypothetical protein